MKIKDDSSSFKTCPTISSNIVIEIQSNTIEPIKILKDKIDKSEKIGENESKIIHDLSNTRENNNKSIMNTKVKSEEIVDKSIMSTDKKNEVKSKEIDDKSIMSTDKKNEVKSKEIDDKSIMSTDKKNEVKSKEIDDKSIMSTDKKNEVKSKEIDDKSIMSTDKKNEVKSKEIDDKSIMSTDKKNDVKSKEISHPVKIKKENNVIKSPKIKKGKKVIDKSIENMDSTPKKVKKEKNTENREILHIRNISKQTTEKELLSNFEIIGDIDEFHYLTRSASINEGIIIYKYKGHGEEAIQLMNNVKINGKLCKLKLVDEDEKDTLMKKENKSVARVKKSSETENSKGSDKIDNKLKSPKKISTPIENESLKKEGTKRKLPEKDDTIEKQKSQKKIASSTPKKDTTKKIESNKSKDVSEKTPTKKGESNKSKDVSEKTPNKKGESNKSKNVSEKTPTKKGESNKSKNVSEKTPNKKGESNKSKDVSEKTPNKKGESNKSKDVSEKVTTKKVESNKSKNASEKATTSTNSKKRKLAEETETQKKSSKRKATEKKNSTDNIKENETTTKSESTNETSKHPKTNSKSKIKTEPTESKSQGDIIKFFFIKRIVMNQVVSIYSVLEEYGNILSFEYIKNKKFEGLWNLYIKLEGKPSKLEELIEIRKISVDGEKIKCKEITEETFKEKIDFINKSNDYRYSNNDKYNEEMKNSENKRSHKNNPSENPIEKDKSKTSDHSIKEEIKEQKSKKRTKEATTKKKATTKKPTKKSKKTVSDTIKETQNIKYDLINELHDYSYNVFSPNKDVLHNHTQCSLFPHSNDEMNSIDSHSADDKKSNNISPIQASFIYRPAAMPQSTPHDIDIQNNLTSPAFGKNTMINTASTIGVSLSQIELSNPNDNIVHATTSDVALSLNQHHFDDRSIHKAKSIINNTTEIINNPKIEHKKTLIVPSNAITSNSNPSDLLNPSSKLLNHSSNSTLNENFIPNTTKIDYDLKKTFDLNKVSMNDVKSTAQPTALSIDLTKSNANTFLNHPFYINNYYSEFNPTNDKNSYISIFGEEEEDDESPFKSNINFNTMETNELTMLQNLRSLHQPNTTDPMLVSPTASHFSMAPLNATNLSIPGVQTSNLPVTPSMNSSKLPLTVGASLINSTSTTTALPTGGTFHPSSSLPNSALNSPTRNLPLRSLSTNNSPLQPTPKATSLSNLSFNPAVPTVPSQSNPLYNPPPLNSIGSNLSSNLQQTRLTPSNTIPTIDLTQSSLPMSITKPEMNSLVEESFDTMPTMDTMPKMTEIKRETSTTNLNYSSFPTASSQDAAMTMGMNMNLGMNLGMNMNMSRSMANAPLTQPSSLPLMTMSNVNANTYPLTNTNPVSSLSLMSPTSTPPQPSSNNGNIVPSMSSVPQDDMPIMSPHPIY
ncbi:hypothetical protein BCR36DRAFT_579722 [Piromyces finnis]|uniref:RRM domain-containing protein n=1 Tax=Piromyces finnis TaxID=1754191 RepID=A0A1Y1VKU1_9FUNG|nr:hypothetical protein BCR36DRAFT_579722 [Piromyces finnis]|eukprot:ORX59089.1 hypothetical protein BCR36DRAFT_579722 [Piromyces finnis]